MSINRPAGLAILNKFKKLSSPDSFDYSNFFQMASLRIKGKFERVLQQCNILQFWAGLLVGLLEGGSVSK